MGDTIKQRKQWKTTEPNHSLFHLRSQLAEDGCVNSQLIIAKQLLDENHGDDSTLSNNGKLAVHWLCEGAESGSAEASQLLVQCFYANKGISDDNFDRVHNLISLSGKERTARGVAAGILKSVSTVEQSGSITLGQLKELAAVNNSQAAVDDSGLCKRPSNATLVLGSGVYLGNRLDEADLIAVVKCIMNGVLPSIDIDEKCEDVPEPVTSISAAINRFLFEPFRKSIMRTSERSLSLIEAYTTASNLRLVLQLILFTTTMLAIVCPFNILLSALSVVVFYSSLIGALFCTLRILESNFKLETFKRWCDVLSIAGDKKLDSKMAVYFYYANRSRYYWAYLFALTCMVLTFNMSNLIPFSELTVVSLVLFAVLFWNCNAKFDKTVLTAVFINFLISIPSIFQFFTGEEERFIPTDIGIVPVFNSNLHLQINSFSVLYLVLVYMYYRMAKRALLHVKLLPNLLCNSWLHLAFLFLTRSSLLGLAVTVGLWGFLSMAIPLVGHSLSFSAAGLIFKLIYNFDSVIDLMLSLVIVGTILIFGWAFKKSRSKNRSFVFLTIVPFFVLILTVMVTIKKVPMNEESIEPMSWDTYYKLCHQGAWDSAGSMHRAQLHCAHFKGAPISWEGKIAAIELTSISNPVETFFDKFGNSISDWFKCQYGSRYSSEDCESGILSMGVVNENMNLTVAESLEMSRCLSVRYTMKDKCHITHWNTYSFRIEITISTGMLTSARVYLDSDDNLAYFVLHLLPGEVVKFNGFLHSGLGGIIPVIRLTGLECSNCHYLPAGASAVVKDSKSEALGKIEGGVQTLLNFYFSPVFHYNILQ